MSSTPELIQAVESAGGRFVVDGDRLGIVPATAAQPVLEELRLHKFKVIDLLAQRPPMPPGIRLVSWSPKAAPVQLSRWETVTDTETFIRTTLQQVDARLHGKDWLAGNWTLSTLLARLEACGCHVALDDPRKALQ